MMETKKQDRYLTIIKVAEILGCSERHVYEMVKKGKLKALRLGIRAIRISEKSLNTFIESSILDPDEYFGFAEVQRTDTNSVHIEGLIGPTGDK